jgi:hypothetical protein
MEDFKTMIKMVFDTRSMESAMSYCDFIADLIKALLPGASSGNIKVGPVQYDLHSTDGYMVSTTKKLEAEYLGRKYMITIEEIPNGNEETK